jgi:hypothetical protein
LVICYYLPKFGLIFFSDNVCDRIFRFDSHVTVSIHVFKLYALVGYLFEIDNSYDFFLALDPIGQLSRVAHDHFYHSITATFYQVCCLTYCLARNIFYTCPKCHWIPLVCFLCWQNSSQSIHSPCRSIHTAQDRSLPLLTS